MKRKISRVKFYFLKSLVGFLVYIDSRWYMKYYHKLLQSAGINFTGIPRFIAKSVRFDDFDRITIGDRFVASMNVHFLTHDYSLTTALIAIGEKPQTDVGMLRNIVVGDNVFIGMNTILLPGTTIGDNVIIGAGSVVRGRVPSNSVIAGNPVQILGSIEEYAEKQKSRINQGLQIDKK
ncbi:acyltransferase [Microbacter margulisiae]|uniref:Acetyltransferase-like isoleucine patch superfamily enzyme n=1 Tax=Microbacter margulisiae TaxID=1350067 RepID=A0A7W5DPM6_9PORP|nr:acyltransferase [Microbacter margulisiae]MBB3185983.1 acetyltransferase-like isoleucine patch superfamily enzyme [Microbacter margulisiae]